MLWAVLLACTVEEDSGDSTPEVVEQVFAYSVTPEPIVFGEQAVGDMVSQTLVITNTGNVDLLLIGLDVTDGRGLELTRPLTPVVAPNTFVQVPVSWVPGSTGELSAEVSLTMGPSPNDTTVVKVPVSGTALGAVLSLSSDEYTFDEVPVGCEREVTITVSNSGNIPMDVSSLNLVGDSSFRMGSTEQPLPWSLDPFQSEQFTVYFAPKENSWEGAVVSLDTSATEGQVSLSGLGTVDGENTLTWTVGERSKSTILIHANECVIDGNFGTYSQQLEDALPTFFQGLIDNKSSFRVAFIWNRDGSQTGSVDYIDESYTAAEATAIALEMIQDGANAGDNDASYTTLFNAIEAQSDWLFEDDWEDSKLNLMAFNRDQEQSGGSYIEYVATARSYKDDPDKVVFHAIAGPPPSGCGSAESFILFKQAIDETGGVFTSICEPDWDSNMEKLIAGSVAGAEYFALNGTVLVSSIDVRVDSVKQLSGWSYDSSLNAVVFDEDVYPSRGAEVEIYYLKSDACG